MAKRNVSANSPLERTSLASLDQKLAMAKRCSHGNAYFTLWPRVIWQIILSLGPYIWFQNYDHK